MWIMGLILDSPTDQTPEGFPGRISPLPVSKESPVTFLEDIPPTILDPPSLLCPSRHQSRASPPGLRPGILSGEGRRLARLRTTTGVFP